MNFEQAKFTLARSTLVIPINKNILAQKIQWGVIGLPHGIIIFLSQLNTPNLYDLVML
jgi:hypothetical protein